MRNIIRLAEWLPIISGLIECSYEDYKEALKEWFSTLLIATSPVWLGAFVILICSPDTKDSLTEAYSHIVLVNIKKGELVIYCTTLLAPVFYLVLHDRKTDRAFPSKISSMLIVLVIWLLSGSIFAIQRAGLYFNPDTTFKISVVLFLSSIFILYVAIVYNNSRFPNFAKRFRDQEEDFSKKLKKHRR